jgi:hypothetical protein
MNTQTRIIVAVAAVLVAIDLAARAFLPVPGGGVVSAREIRLTDRFGQTRALLTTDASGEPGLIFFDKSGQRRLQLDNFQNVPSLILNDESEARRVYFGMDQASGDGLYQLGDAEGNWTSATGPGRLAPLTDPTVSVEQGSFDTID